MKLIIETMMEQKTIATGDIVNIVKDGNEHNYLVCKAGTKYFLMNVLGNGTIFFLENLTDVASLDYELRNFADKYKVYSKEAYDIQLVDAK